MKRFFTQEELADRIGCTQSAISKMLTRNARPRRTTIFKLAEALKVESTELWPQLEVAAVKDDDHNALEPESDTELWDAEIVRLFENTLIPKPDKTGQFSSDIDFKMTKVESRHLRQRFPNTEKGSVFANLFRNDSFEPADYPWQWDYPESLQLEIYYAEHVSMLAKIATLLYYRLLDTKRTASGFAGCGIDLDQSIHDCWTLCRDQILEWNIDEFQG